MDENNTNLKIKTCTAYQFVLSINITLYEFYSYIHVYNQQITSIGTITTLLGKTSTNIDHMLHFRPRSYHSLFLRGVSACKVRFRRSTSKSNLKKKEDKFPNTSVSSSRYLKEYIHTSVDVIAYRTLIKVFQSFSCNIIKIIS